jgi:hypothetical protein
MPLNESNVDAYFQCSWGVSYSVDLEARVMSSIAFAITMVVGFVV